MKHTIFRLMILLFVLTSLPAVVQAKGTVTKEILTSHGKKRGYYLFVPEKISTLKNVPLVVLLHGSGRNGFSLVEKWKDLADKEEIILAGPDSINSAQWTWGADGPDFLHDLVEALKKTYPINARRVYLFGHSAGAIFGLCMSLIESEYFAATAVHAGALQKEDYALTDFAKRKIPMAIWVGDSDAYFPLSLVRATRDMLVSRGLPIQLTEIPNHNHWYYDAAPKINRNAWEFLKKHELPADPVFQEFEIQK